MVKFSVTTLSQPVVVCKVSVYVPVDEYVLPFHTMLSQAEAVVSPVVALLIVKFNVTTLSQPEIVCNISE